MQTCFFTQCSLARVLNLVAPCRTCAMGCTGGHETVTAEVAPRESSLRRSTSWDVRRVLPSQRMPMPPDRGTHNRYIQDLNAYLSKVTKEPCSFRKLVECRRDSCFPDRCSSLAQDTGDRSDRLLKALHRGNPWRIIPKGSCCCHFGSSWAVSQTG